MLSDAVLAASVEADGRFPLNQMMFCSFHLADGTEVYSKRLFETRDIDSEELAHLVAQVVEAPVPALYRVPNSFDLVLEFVEGVEGWQFEGFEDIDGEWVGPPHWLPYNRGAQRLGLLDDIVQNADRNISNFLVQPDHSIYGIDHADCFDEEYVSGFGFTSYFHRNLLTPAERVRITKGLIALEKDFDRLRRGDWHQMVIRNWNRIRTGRKGNG